MNFSIRTDCVCNREVPWKLFAEGYRYVHYGMEANDYTSIEGGQLIEHYSNVKKMQIMTDHGPKCFVSVEQLNKAQSTILLLQVCTCMYISCMYV